MKKKIFRICITFLIVFALCIPVMAATVKLNKTAVTLYKGQTFQLKLSGASGKVSWKSRNSSVAVVNASGKITAKKPGTAKIVATVNKVSKVCTVTVKKPAIKLSKASATLYCNDKTKNTITLKASVYGAKKTVKWTTSNKAVAKVSNGKVTALKEGTAVIKATANGVTAQCKIIVKKKQNASTESVIELIKKGDYAGARAMTKQLPAYANEKCVTTMPYNIRKAYYGILLRQTMYSEAYKDSYLNGYYFTDIDKDGTAELLMKTGTCEDDYTLSVYTYEENQAKKISLLTIRAGNSRFFANPTGTGFYKADTYMERELIVKYDVQKNYFSMHQLADVSITGNEGYVDLPYQLKYYSRSEVYTLLS